MGGKNPKQYEHTTHQVQQQEKDSNFESVLCSTFQNAAQGVGGLTRNKFNEALQCMEMFNMKRLRDTPLADRLFVVFDKNKQGNINEQEFLDGLKQLINDKEMRIQFSFKIYDRDNQNRISRKNFIDFFEESWKAAFRILCQELQSRNILGIDQSPMAEHNVSFAQINQCANSNIQKLRAYAEALFQKLDANRQGYLTYGDFKNWITGEEENSIFANYEKHINKCSVEIPTNLYKLEVK